MGLTVVDASVAAKWALDESGSVAATRLLAGRHMLAAPELLMVEGASAITRACRQGRLTVAQAEQALDTWVSGLENGSVELVSNATDLRRAGTLSCELAHPIADCLYLALAERLGAELVTADETFARRAVAVYPRVQLLNADG